LVIDARGENALAAARAELSEWTEVRAFPGDVADGQHRRALINAARELGGLDALVNNAGTLGPSPLPDLWTYPLEGLQDLFRTNVVAPLALIQEARTVLHPGARIVNVTSDAAVEPYPGWGGYGAGKAALEQLTAVLAEENPQLRVYRVDPGDMRTQMHQDAFPGEDISDRPLADSVVPHLLSLLVARPSSGRYRAADFPVAAQRVGA
jgi:NAD(P)-dependent dehydrogenase (short-subunit alcohol dehydrogenase family)